ncbi:MAG TPA: PfkB family carbohydrate kinase [Anaerolineales bacterium]|nr:PfkB family carbohydrate kinase [Anaerolineales bacterium]
MPEIITLGELLIDFVPTISGVSLMEAPAFKKAPGGAPANVAVGVSRLGITSGFMGKVGDDAFGHFLAQTLGESGVDISALQFSQQARTALAFVSLTAEGERDFLFYRHPSADMLYSPEEVDPVYVQTGRIFHFGSITLIDEPVRSATLKALEIARAANLMVSYDPNLRLSLWPDAETARRRILQAWPLAHVIKVSAEELEFLSGEPTLEAGARRLWSAEQRLLIVTVGKKGCVYFTTDGQGATPGYTVEVVDTTGAGDGFVAGLLYGLANSLRTGRPAWEDSGQLAAICRYANAVGALTTTQRGAIPALPSAAAVQAFMRAMETAESSKTNGETHG